MIISQEVRDDPEVSEWLNEANNSLTFEEFNASLKGYDDRFKLLRIKDKRVSV